MRGSCRIDRYHDGTLISTDAGEVLYLDGKISRVLDWPAGAPRTLRDALDWRGKRVSAVLGKFDGGWLNSTTQGKTLSRFDEWVEETLDLAFFDNF